MKNYQTLIGLALVAAAIVAAALIVAGKIQAPGRFQGVGVVCNGSAALVVDTHTGDVSLEDPK